MFRNMPATRTLTPGYTVIHPNRDKAICKTTKAIVVLILLVSIGLMLIVTFGGWSKLQGLKPFNFAWCLLYLIFAFYTWRWNRGVLPIAAAFAILLLIASGAGLEVRTLAATDSQPDGVLVAPAGFVEELVGLVTDD